ncbi:hypothetical protein FOZ63_010291, partial [Perkinsus olseni]
FFAHICTFGPEGVEKVEKLVDLTPHEQKRMAETLEKLREDVKRGLDFMKSVDTVGGWDVRRSVWFKWAKSPVSVPERSSISFRRTMKVCLIGASGGIGRPLALLLKMNPEIDEVALYDVPGAHFPVPGVVADLSHINTPAKVAGYQGFDEIADCLDGAHMIIVTAGIAQKPGMTRDDLFNVNARIMRDLSFKFAKHAPTALVCIMSNPETALVPITCEVYKQVGVFDKRKIMGLMSLDVTRARTFYAEATNQDVEKVDVPVIGGHGGCAILP